MTNHYQIGIELMQDMKSNPEEERVEAALADWWRERSRTEIEGVVPKAVEYAAGTATDLVEVGKTMGLLMGRSNLTDEEATEIGIHFYLIGKIARWTAAIKHGRRVSDDTLHDIAVYTKMMQRTRDVGGWPFAPELEN